MTEEETSQPEEVRREMFVGSNVHYSSLDGKPLCSYSQKLCKQRRLNGFAFCIRHVLEDPHCNFKQCAYVAKYNGNRCTNPIPAKEDRVYCNSHLQVLGILPKTRKKRQGEQDSPQAVAGPVKVKKLLVPALSDGSAHIGALKPQAVGSKRSKFMCADIVLSDLSQLLAQPCMGDLRTRLQEEREAVGEKDLLPLVSLLSDEEEDSATGGRLPPVDLIMRSDLPRNKLPVATEGQISQNHTVAVGSNRCNGSDGEVELHSAYVEKCKQRLKQLRQEAVKSRRIFRLCHRDAAIDASIARGLVAASRQNAYAAGGVLLSHRQQSCRKLSRKPSRLRRLKHCAYIQPNNIYCGYDRLPFSRYCATHAAHDARQVLFNNRVDWNTVTWSETLPIALPPEPLLARGASSHKMPAKTLPKSTPKLAAKLTGRATALKQGDRNRRASEADDGSSAFLEEPKRATPTRGRGGRGRGGRGAGRGSTAAARSVSVAPGRGGSSAARGHAASTPAGRAKAPVSRPPVAGLLKPGPGGKRKAAGSLSATAAAAASSTLVQSGSLGDPQKLVLTIKRPIQAPVIAPVPEEPMSESSSGSYSGSSDSESGSGSESGSESDSSSDSSTGTPDQHLRAAHANGSVNGVVAGNGSAGYTKKADAARLSSQGDVSADSPFYSDQGSVMWSPSKSQSSDQQVSRPLFASPNYAEFGSSSPAFGPPSSYHPSLALSSPPSAADGDLYH